MAEPLRRSRRCALDWRARAFFIVEARFYEAIGAMLFAGARAAIEAAGATATSSACPARWNSRWPRHCPRWSERGGAAL